MPTILPALSPSEAPSGLSVEGLRSAPLPAPPSALTETDTQALRAQLAETTVMRLREPLARRTTLRVGGAAEVYLEPSSEAELGAILSFCQARSLPWMVLGRGSNLLIRESGVRGVVLCLAHPSFSQVEAVEGSLVCGAGAKLKTVAIEARRHGFSGMEFLEGIPGSLGGALRMNAGAMGSWLFEVLVKVRFMDGTGQVFQKPATEVPVEYRRCPLFRDHIALAAVLRGPPAASEAIRERMDRFRRRRWKTQPHQPSAGCIFKNPAGIAAGRLIDELGLKGCRVGGAVVSNVHANFIINDGNARAGDVLQLIEVIRAKARADRGIELETEVEIIGEP